MMFWLSDLGNIKDEDGNPIAIVKEEYFEN